MKRNSNGPDRLRTLYQAVEQSPSTVVITDRRGNIEYVNPKFSDLTGYAAEEVLGENPRMLKSGEQDGAFYREMWQTVAAGDEWRGEFSNRKKNGQVYWEFASISPVCDDEGRITHFVKVAEDITARRQAEEALRRYAGELEARNRELDAFAHTVAHDIRNPLSVTLGLAQVLESHHGGMAEEEVARYLRKIARNARKMSNIIDELLLLASVRSADVPSGPLQMESIVEEAWARLADLAAQYQATISMPRSWPRALGYGPWVEEIWVNYLSNAIKYGGRPPRIEVGGDGGHACQRPHMVRFWVRDNGEGLTPEEQAQLFVPFTQLAQVRAGGHGLGLSIVRRIAHKLGGDAGVESNGVPGQGSTFYVCLPRTEG